MNPRRGRPVARWAFVAALALMPTLASAGPDPAKLKAAGDSFEAGTRAYADKKFEEAAQRFEAADEAVPSAQSLSLAIRARSEAGQLSRAASLSALALDLYPSDAAIVKLANDTLAKSKPKLEEVKISCVSPCIVAADAHIVHGEPATRWTVYLEPGNKVSVGASFFGGISAKEQYVKAVAGESTSIRFEPPKSTSTGQGGGPANTTTGGGATPTGTGGAPPIEDPPPSTGSGVEPTDPPKKPFGIHPAPFVVGLVATVGLGATTIWSGVDTLNNPGPDTVRAQCKGQGEECPAYQDGLAHELRTNVLIGVTAGLGATTVILAIVTNWKGKPKDQTTEAPTAEQKKDAIRRSQGAFSFADPWLWVDPLGASDSAASEGSAAAVGEGALVSAGVRF
ncbi:MAG: hypothetical protein U0414_34945 [Polyangiaceae bacterium]